MDLQTFKNEILKALRKPEDWEIEGGFLSHRRADVSIRTSCLSDHHCAAPVVQRMYSGGPVEIFILKGEWRETAEACLKELVAQQREAERQAEEERREDFLSSFGGFE